MSKSKIIKILMISSITLLISFNAYSADIIYSTTKPVVIETKGNIVSEETPDPVYRPGESVGTKSSEVVGSVNVVSSIDYNNIYNLIEDSGNFYCKESDGTMAKNAWRKISRASFARYAPVEGFTKDYIWAYFTSTGKAIKASNGSMRKINVGNYTYAFNEYGQLLTGFFNENGEIWNENDNDGPFALLSGEGSTLYFADLNTGVLKTGWLKIENMMDELYPNKNFLWLYFNPSNYKIVRSTSNNYKSQSIDGFTYAFDDNGIMLTGFEPYHYNEEHGGNTTKMVYFAEDGHEIKDRFVNIEYGDEDDLYEIYGDDMYDDEDIMVYLGRKGQMFQNTIKKVGNAYYGFDERGVVVRGLSVWNNKEYVATIDVDATDGKELIMGGTYVDKRGSNQVIQSGDVLHFFDASGRRQTKADIEFADEKYTFEGSNSGGYDRVVNTKCYSHGLLIKPPSYIKYGIYIPNPTKRNYTMDEICSGIAMVVGSGGGQLSGNNNVRKDENDNYILMKGDYLANVYNVQVREWNGYYQFRSEDEDGREKWIVFGEKDAYGKTCVLERTPNGTRLSNGAVAAYQDKIASEAALNFYLTR